MLQQLTLLIKRFSRCTLSTSLFVLLGMAVVAQPSPTAWYELDGNTSDSQGSNDGTNNGASFISGQFGQAADMNLEDYIALPTGIMGSGTGSVSLWINTTQADDGAIFYGSTTTDGNLFGSHDELHINMNSSGEVEFYVEGDPDVDFTGPVVNDGTWHHIAAAWDQSGSITFYVDNSQVGSASHTGNVFSFSGVFYVGRPGQDWRQYEGTIDQVRIYDNIVLSSSDVDALFNESGSDGTTQYNLATSTNGPGNISLNPSGGTYDEGTSVTVTANPASGWEFDSWSGDLSGSINPESIVMDSDKSITANFTETTGGGSTITLQENQTGFCNVDGPIESEHSGYTGDGYANTDNASGNSVEWSVDAPSSGSYTLQWRYANGASNRTAEVLVNSSSQVTGIDFNGTGAWDAWNETSEVSVSLQSGTNTITLVAETSGGLANIDYIEVTGNSPAAGDCGTGGTTQYTLSTNVNGSGNISLSPSGGTYDEGTSVTVTANPASGWEFDNWSGDLSGPTNPQSILMDADRSVTANFSETTGGGTSTTLQGENACSFDGDLESEHSGFNGSGYVNFTNSTGTAIEWIADVASGGSHTFDIRFANGGGSNRDMELSINGSTAIASIDFNDTGGWTSWNTTSVNASLNSGYNTITLISNQTDGGPNIDQVEITGSSLTLDCTGGVVPGQASNPIPANGATGVLTTTSLSWSAGSDADTHEVYFGTDSSPDASESQGSQSSTTFTPSSELSPNTTYYWRIDEVNTNGTTTGNVWSFTTNDGSEPEVDESLVGYATLAGGTTGGSGGTSVTVSTGDEMIQAISDKQDGIISGPLTIYVNGTINTSNTSNSKIDIKDVNDISVLGVGTNGEFDGVGIKIWRASNIIIRNVTIHHVSDGDGDCIGIEGPSDHIWVDHCELYNEFQGVDKDFYDGLLDAKGDSEYITVSWNYFHDSWKTSLAGSSDGDEFDRKITYHHNWYENNNSRLPLYRFGNAHIFNNYYNGIESTGINTRMGACVRIENNYFENAHNPIVSAYSDELGASDESGNIFGSNVTWDFSGDPNEPLNCSWSASYSYSEVLHSASEVPSVVQQNAGVGIINTSSRIAVSENDRSKLNKNESMNITLYPNPANSTLNVALKGFKDKGHIKVFNTLGEAILVEEIYNSNSSLDLSNFESGVYILKVKYRGNSLTERFIVQ